MSPAMLDVAVADVERQDHADARADTRGDFGQHGRAFRMDAGL